VEFQAKLLKVTEFRFELLNGLKLTDLAAFKLDLELPHL
jgi:hypothetical protein